MSTEQIKRKTRADTGPRLIDRDIKALEWIAQQYAVTIDHLAILLARQIEPGQYKQTPKEAGRLTEKRVMAIIKRWEQLGLIEKKWIIHGEPCWVWLTNEGLRVVQEQIGELRPYAPTPGKLNHLYQVNVTRLFVEAKRPDAEWIGEREIRSNQKVQPGKRLHTPDAIVKTNNHTIALEIELTTKTYDRLDKILLELALNADYYTVWYFCKGRAYTIVKTSIEKMRETHRNKFVVYNLDTMTL